MPPGGGYSAGSIFLQIQPSFRGVPEQIRAEARAWGKAAGEGMDEELSKRIPEAVNKGGKKAEEESQKSGEKAGKKYAGAFSESAKKAIRDASREVGTIKIAADDSDARRTVKELKASLKELGKAKIGVDMDSGDFFARITEIEAVLRELQDTSVNIDTRVNSARAMATIARMREELMRLSAIQVEPEIKIDRLQGEFERTIKTAIDRALAKVPPVELTADSSEIDHEIAKVREELYSLRDVHVGVDMSAEDVFLRIGELQQKLDNLSRQSAGIDARVNTHGAATELEAVLKMVEHLNGQQAEVHVGVDGAAKTIAELEAVEKKLNGVQGSSDNAGNAFRAFSGVILGIASVGPAVLPIIGALAAAGGGGAVLGAAGLAGVGVAGMAFSGVGGAVQAMQAQQKSGGQDAIAHAKAVRNAGDTVIRARQTVATARTTASRTSSSDTEAVATATQSASDARTQAAIQAAQSARAIAQADRQVESAERSLQNAQRAATDAQKALTQAREDEVKAERDLQFQLRGGVLAQEQAVLDLADAQAEYDKIKNDPGASDEAKKRALINLQEQQLNLDQLKASNSDLAEQQAQVAKTGVEGSDRVVAAQQRVKDANQGVADAQDSVLQAQQAASDARIQAAQQAAQSTEQIANADRAVADARTKQAQDAVDNQQAITDAQRELIKAQENYQEAVDSTTGSQRNLADAMAQLSPAGQTFAKFVFSTLLPAFYAMRGVAQEGFLPGFTQWISTLVGYYGPQLLAIVGSLAKAMGDMFATFAQALMGPAFGGLFDMIQRDGPIFIGMLAQVLSNLGTGVAWLMQALEPLGFFFGQWLVDATARFADLMAGLGQNAGFQEFIAIAERDLPLVAQFIGALAGAIWNLFKALLPYGELVMKMLTGLLDWIGGMDVDTLQAVALAIIGVFLAFQAITGMTALLSGLGSVVSAATTALKFFGLMATTEAIPAIVGIGAVLGIALGAFILIGIGLYELWQHSQTFRDIVMAVWGAIQYAAGVVVNWFMTYALPVLQQIWNGIAAAAQWLWTDILQPIFGLMGHIFSDVWAGLQWAWTNIGEPIFKVVASVITTLWTDIIEPIFSGLIIPIFKLLWTILSWAWETIGKPIFDVIIVVITAWWDYVLKPIFEALGWVFKTLWEGISWVWFNVGKPIFDFIGWVLRDVWDHVIQPIFNWIKDLWNVLWVAMQIMWEQYGQPLFDAWMKVMGWLWENVLQPIFGFIGDAWDNLMKGMRWVYDNVIHPMWDIFKSAMGDLGDFFKGIVDTIGNLWDGLKKLIAVPINFVIQTILDDGLFAAWNAIVDAFGLPGANSKDGGWKLHINPIQMAEGGKIRGPYVGRAADNVMGVVNGTGQPIRVNPREFIQPVNSVDYYGDDVMEAMRRRAIPREMFASMGFAGGGSIPGFAPGGSIPAGTQTWHELDAIRKKLFPGSLLNDAYRPGASDWHGRGDAIDIGWAGNDYNHLFQIAAVLAQQFPNSTELIHDPNGSIKNGKPVGPGFWGSDTWRAHMNHVHWAMTPEALAMGNANPGGAPLWGNPLDVFNQLTDSIKGVGEMIAKFGDSHFTQALIKMPADVVGKMWDAAKGLIGDFFAGQTGDSGDGRAATSDQDVVGTFKSMMGPFGWDSGAEWHAVDYIISHESGWDPRAQNPGSTASGLGQFIDGTWRAERPGSANAYGRMKDAPVALQASAFANYIGDRYGDPIGAMNFWMRNQFYSKGGSVADDGTQSIVPELQDMGGWINPGLNVIMNRTRRPEPVVNPATLDAITAIAATGGTRGGDSYTLVGIDPTNAGKLLDQVHHRSVVKQRGGRY